jgi:3-oxoacyl-[acyl-carrier protein] reductase
MSLTDSHVVITGAAGRLGRTLVRTLLDAGASVTAIDLEKANLGGARFVEANLTEEASVTEAFKSIRDGGKPVDALIHAVGMWGETPMASAGLADWKTMIDVNLTSTFLCFREGAKLMKQGGRLIAFSSGQGADRGVAGQAAYAAAKAGVMRVVESTDAELREKNIRAIGIAPSMILFGGDEGKGVRDTELADLCVFLLSPTGAALGGNVVRAYGTA